MARKSKKLKQKPLCLITGASAGIGAALAREFAAAGWNLALTARREEPMVELAKELKAKFGTVSHILPADLSKPGACADILARLKKKKAHVDGLVNNAGYGLTGYFMHNDWQAHKDFLSVMLEVPCEMTHRVLPGMQERGFGRILNVASLAGHVPGSRGHTLYAATKSFLIKFSQSLNLEHKDEGIQVSALCPGFTYSEFHDVNQTRDAVDKLPDWMWMSAEEVAESGFLALEKGQAVHIPGRGNKVIAGLAKLLPDSIALALMNKNSDRVRKGHK
ncbi:MAG: SDR family oxidoreductase [Acidimicrobiales bacterium]|nr:SDR family oxidoreductase [Hyphomonadaceae bacterium]RZV44266.1 MAG: SDR family oxidoreductase [Acidimicrobiales bacterium]